MRFASWMAAAVAAVALAGLASPGAQAQSDDRPIVVIVPYTAGTGVDVAARILMNDMEKRLGRSIAVENRAGASGNIGAQFVARAKPDGHTLLFTASTYVKNATILKNVPYDVLNGFTPIVQIGSADFVLAVNSAVPVKSLKGFVAYAKARPGEINYGSPGFGTPHHLGMELLQLSTGIRMTHIPFKGAGGMFSSFLGNHVNTSFLPLQVAQRMAKGGKIRSLAVAGGQRSPIAPELPTFDEQGVDDFDIDSWYALLGPAGMPRDIADRFNAMANEALKDPQVHKALLDQGLTILGGTPDQLVAVIKRDLEKWTKIAEEAKLEKQ